MQPSLSAFQIFNQNLAQLEWQLFYLSWYLVYIAPFFLGWGLWKTYLHHIRRIYVKGQKRILLEIKLPKELNKSPAAMELVTPVFYQTYVGELIDQWVKGNVQGWFSLELVSKGGEIHFYFNVPEFFKDLVETQIYSQYPEVEVYQVEDYVKEVTFGTPGTDWDIAGWEFKLAKADAYPIKTYFEYGLDKDPKEEFKIDPMTPMIEFLGSIGANERVWFQIMVMATRDRFPVPFKWDQPSTWTKKKDWKDDVKKEIEKVLKRDKKADMAESFTKLMPTRTEAALAESMERSLGKLAFDVGIRALYCAKGGKGIRPAVKVGVGNSIKQFGAPGMNTIKTARVTGFNNPWQDYNNIRKFRLQKKFFKWYTLRSYFYPPASQPPMILTSEELATVYHFPGQVATTPSLGRIPSKRGEPPTNLPI